MSRIRPRVLLLLFAAAALAAPAPAQSDTQIQTLAEEQEMLRRRLDTLRQKMTLLAGRLDAEGRTHAADLLRRGLARLDLIDTSGHSLDRAMAKAAGDLRGGTPGSVLEVQERIASDLEQLLSILLDRQDLERLEKELEAYREWLETLEGLTKQEQELRGETQELSRRGASEAEREAREAIEGLRARQAELARQAEETERSLRSLQQAADELDRLVASQGAVLDSIRTAAESGEGAEDPVASTLLARAKVLAEALERARALAREAEAMRRFQDRAEDLSRRGQSGDISPEDLARAGGELAEEARREGEPTRSAPLERAAKALEALAVGDPHAQGQLGDEARSAGERAKEAFDRAGAATQGFRSEAEGAKPSTESGRKASEDAAAAARRAAEALDGRGDLSAAAEAAREATRALERAGRASAGARERTAREEVDLADRAAQVAESLESLSSASGAQEAGRSAESAAGSLREAAQDLSEGDPVAAERPASEALERLRRAREEIEKALEDERRLVRPKEEEIAAEQESLAEEAERLASDLDRRGSEGGLSPSQSSGASSSTREAGSRMREASGATRQGDRPQASASRSAARQALDRALEALGAGRRLQDEALEESQELARRQEEIRKKILELERRIQERANPPNTGGLDRASEAAGDAGEALDRGDVGEAEPLEEDVERYLDQAREEIEREQERYLRLREEELLFKIGDELTRMAEIHAEARARTVEVDRERREAQGLTRAMRLALRRVSRDEESIAVDSARIAEAIEKEGTTVFAFLLRSNEEDLRRIVELLSSRDAPTDERVQGLQEDVAQRIEQLRQALRDEIRRRQQGQGQGGQNFSNPGSRRPPLVNDLAELRMLKMLEEAILARTEGFAERLDLFEEVDPFATEELLRLGHRHHRITELFEEFMRRLGHDPDAPETKPEGEGR